MTGPQPAARQSAEEIARLVRLSILEHRTLRVIYDGHERLLCPQMLGRSQSGRRRLLCLQVGGESASGLRHAGQGDWRCLSLEKFSEVEFVTAPWQTATDPLRRPKCIDQIELAVSSVSTRT
jgi:hypothetical protein